ncbi:MAG: hypothetical protein AAGD01_19410 [Acidobacteriota bacterium]
MSRILTSASVLALLVLLLSTPTAASAQVIEFGHLDALAGGITAGDAPGYPVTLSAATSYRLTSSLYVSAGVDGIQPTQDHITLDLNGFTIFGSSPLSPSQYGVYGPNRNYVTVKNGNIRAFAKVGIYLQDFSQLQDLRLISNSSQGAYLRNGALIENVQAITNKANGILCRDACVFNDVVAFENSITGILCADLCNIRNSVTKNNGSAGIITGDSSVVRDNVSSFNKVGIFVSPKSLAKGNVVTDNTNSQLVVGQDSGTSTNVVDDMQIVGDHELDPSACIGGLCL